MYNQKTVKNPLFSTLLCDDTGFSYKNGRMLNVKYIELLSYKTVKVCNTGFHHSNTLFFHTSDAPT